MAFEAILQELAEKRHNALQMGGADKIKKQHARGRYTARERIDRLLDRGSFLEMGLLAHSDWPGMADKTPADGLICGYGQINGRWVAVVANDFTVLASTNARVNLKKVLQFKTQVKDRFQIPLIWLGEAGGARMPDCQGAKGVLTLTGGDIDALMPEYTHFRKQPFIFAAMGECYGVADFEACLADFVVQVKGTGISISGPRALHRAIGEAFSAEEMGGWDIHSRQTGLVDQVAEDEDHCFQIIRDYLSYMPQNCSELPPVAPVPDGADEQVRHILDHLPENRRRTYDIHKIIECLVDGGKIFELKPDIGKMIVTCLARVNGEVVAIVASNPIENVGATDTHGLDKMTSMFCLSDSYNIPLVFLHDTPGHMVGKEAEINKVSAKVINAMQALYQVSVPKITIIVRKSYGQAHGNMCGAGSGPDFVVAWPTAEIGFMEPLIAGDVVYGNLPPDERMQKIDEMISDLSPYPAAGDYYLHDIIDPRETRNYLINVLKIVRASKSRGIGDHRLANWPTKF